MPSGDAQSTNLYVCTDHAGHYPVGVASVVVAPDAATARALLDAELRDHGLNPTDPPYTLRKLSLTEPRAFVLHDGNY